MLSTARQFASGSSQICTAVTYSSRCARSLLDVLLRSLQSNRHAPSAQNPILLFAFAPSLKTPPGILSDITSALTQLYPEHVGCISAPLPYQYFDPRVRAESHSCSLAYAFVNGVSFRSTISGRAEAQVGRWHAARQRPAENTNGTTSANVENSQMQIDLFKSDGQVNWDDVWECSANSVTCSSSPRNRISPEILPDALRNIDPSTIHDILCFSDKAPEGLATVLEGAFPQANKLSLIASSTPFITGRPVTLFHNGSILSNGAVGIALNPSPVSPHPTLELSFPPLVTLSTNLNVTSSQGNLILSLDSGNPTRLLLSAIQKHGLSFSQMTWVGKDDDFYVGVIDPSTEQICQLHRINAGDPSRGTIALDAAAAPKEGSLIRLYRLPRNPVPDAPTYIPDTGLKHISLFVAPEMTPAASFRDELADNRVTDDDVSVVSNAFLAASENGFTLSRGSQVPWKCVVPGGRAGLSWSLPALK